MRLGITRHRGTGTWSSLPHDFELNTEPGFEEVFFHLLSGESQRAIQIGRGVWSDNTDVDSSWPVRDHTFSTIPMGYHPVVGEPGVSVSYVWVYLCKKASWEKI
jgi:5-deoxy-D-glucuronate isomerase